MLAIAAGKTESAYLIARESNPFASICGRICAAPCEDACRRGSVDAPIAIRPLKRYVTEQHGVESLHPTIPTGPPGRSTTWFDRTVLRDLARQPGRRRGRVVIVGAGPAGLAAAHDLALLGHTVTVLESSDQAGGMLRQGVPLYRLSRELLDREIQAILDLGVELRLHVSVGSDVSLAQLRQDYDAVFLGNGLRKGRDLPIDGADLDGVFRAVDFLLNANRGYRVDLGRRVIVVGGGNVAVDAARTALRAQLAQADLERLPPDDLRALIGRTRETMGELVDSGRQGGEILHSAFDVARTALRLGAAEVHMVALEDWQELPASDWKWKKPRKKGSRSTCAWVQTESWVARHLKAVAFALSRGDPADATFHLEAALPIASPLRLEAIRSALGFVRYGRLERAAEIVAAILRGPAPGDPAQGLTLFVANCEVCHGVGGAGGIGPTLADNTFIQSLTDEALLSFVLGGRPPSGMPSWEGRLTPAELQNIIALLRTWQK